MIALQSRPHSTKSMASAESEAKVITSEKRKQQNRAAQKTYREKRKKRLQELEKLQKLMKVGQLAPIGSSPSQDGSNSNDGSHSSPEESCLDVDQLATQADPFATQDAQLDMTPWLNNVSSVPDWADTNLSWELISRTSSTSLGYNSTSSFPLTPSPEIATTPKHATKAGIQNAIVLNNKPPEFFMADPLINTLQITLTSTVTAMMYNSTLLGITPDICCDDNALSPYYSPSLSPDSTTAEILVVAETMSIENIKRDLRPNKKQLTTPHHPSIDILPFPEVRERLIDLTTSDPPLIDEDQFWCDMHNDGLVCWGSISPAKGTSTPGGGAPWESRSWEAARWFLTKWSFVVGGEDGELARNSEWWRLMRGQGQGFSFD